MKVQKIRNSINKIIDSLNEKPRTDPTFEIQRLLRVAGFKIKETSYDNKGNALVQLSFTNDLQDAMKYLNGLDTLPTKVEIKDNKIFIHV